MTIYLIGNSMVKEDNLPLRLQPELERAFPQVKFRQADPTENFIPEDGSIIIDTVVGLDRVQVFTNLDNFAAHKLISPHDYDLLFHLQLLQKLGKLQNFSLIGVPQNLVFEEVLKGIVAILASQGLPLQI